MSIHNALPNLTSDDLAALLGTTRQSVCNWVSDGLPHRTEGRELRFAWKPAHQWWLENKCRTNRTRGTSTPPRVESEARIAAAKAEQEELRLEEKRGRLLDYDEVESEWTRKILAARARLLTIPARLRGPLGPDIARRVEEEVFAAMTELAKEWRDA